MQVSGHSEDDDDILHLTSKIQVSDHSEEEDILPLTSKNIKMKDSTKGIPNKKKSSGEVTGRARNSKEEKTRLMNEKKQQKEVSVLSNKRS